MSNRPSKDDKLALILKTASTVFAEKGYHQASIRDISRASGISLSGLYYYFESKEELLFLIQDHGFGTVLDNLRARLEDEEEPRRRLFVLIENHLRFFIANMDEMKVLSHEADSLTGSYRRRVSAKKKEYTSICMSILEAMRPDDPAVDLRVATFSLFGMMNWIYNWYDPTRDVAVDELVAEMGRIFLRGFASGSEGDAAPDTDTGRSPRGAAPSIWQ